MSQGSQSRADGARVAPSGALLGAIVHRVPSISASTVSPFLPEYPALPEHSPTSHAFWALPGCSAHRPLLRSSPVTSPSAPPVTVLRGEGQSSGSASPGPGGVAAPRLLDVEQASEHVWSSVASPVNGAMSPHHPDPCGFVGLSHTAAQRPPCTRVPFSLSLKWSQEAGHGPPGTGSLGLRTLGTLLLTRGHSTD